MNHPYIIRRKWHGVHPDMYIRDADQNLLYHLKRNFQSSLLNHDYIVLDADDNALAHVRQQNTFALPHYSLIRNEEEIGQMGMSGMSEWYLRTRNIDDVHMYLGFGLPSEFQVKTHDTLLADVETVGINGWRVTLVERIEYDPLELLIPLAMVIRDYTS